MGIFIKFWLFLRCPLTKYGHVTSHANFENFLFCPNSTFNIRESHKICSAKGPYFRSYQQKASRGGGGGGWKTPPQVPLGLMVFERAYIEMN